MVNMCTKKTFIVTILIILIFGKWMTVNAVLIKPTYADNNFPPNQIKVIEEAMREWTVLLGGNDGKELPIVFKCNPNQAKLGHTDVGVRSNGSVQWAVVTIKNPGVYWTLDDPEKWDNDHMSWVDALTVVKHEIGHALGWIDTEGCNFMKKVKEDGGNRFYDKNGNGKFDDGDYDLKDGPGWDGHTESETELMSAEQEQGKRFHPTAAYAKILGDAYGYTVIPEPATVLLIGAGIMFLRRKRLGYTIYP